MVLNSGGMPGFGALGREDGSWASQRAVNWLRRAQRPKSLKRECTVGSSVQILGLVEVWATFKVA
jgi:hypothetical protein